MLTQETIERIDQKLQSGTVPNDVAKEIGTSRATMERELLRLGYEIEVTTSRRLKRTSAVQAIAAELAEANR